MIFFEPGGSSDTGQMSMISAIGFGSPTHVVGFPFQCSGEAYATRRDLDPRFVCRRGRSGVAAARSGDGPRGPVRRRSRPALGFPDGARELDGDPLLGAGF